MHTVVTSAGILAPTHCARHWWWQRATRLSNIVLFGTPRRQLWRHAQRQTSSGRWHFRPIMSDWSSCLASWLGMTFVLWVSIYFFFFFCSNGNRTNDSAFKMRFPMPRDEKRFLGRAHKHPTQGNRTWHGGRMSRNLNVLWQVQVALSDWRGWPMEGNATNLTDLSNVRYLSLCKKRHPQQSNKRSSKDEPSTIEK